MLKEFFNKISPTTRWILIIGLSVIIIISVWFYGAKVWNGIGNYFFHKEATELSQEVKDKLAQAEEQKKILEQTLFELKKAKEELAKAQAARQEAEKIFNDKSKTAKEKVQAYETTVSTVPIHTDPTGVTTSDLCTRAKTINSSPSVIAALCQ